MNKLPQELKDIVFSSTDFNTCYKNNNYEGMFHFIKKIGEEHNVNANGFIPSKIFTQNPNDFYYQLDIRHKFRYIDVKEVVFCLKVLKIIGASNYKIRGFNDRNTSYGLKHIIEDIGKRAGVGASYVSNGSLIIAFIIYGFRYKIVGVNCIFNIEKKLIDILRHMEVEFE